MDAMGSSRVEDGLDTAEIWGKWQGWNPPEGWRGQPFLSKSYKIPPNTEPTYCSQAAARWIMGVNWLRASDAERRERRRRGRRKKNREGRDRRIKIDRPGGDCLSLNRPAPGRPCCQAKRRASEGTLPWVYILGLISCDLRHVL